MNELASWLPYCLGAIAAFAAVHFRRWRIVPSMLLSAFIVLTIWFVASVAGRGTAEAGLNDALLNEGSFGLLFGAIGAGAAYLLRESHGR